MTLTTYKAGDRVLRLQNEQPAGATVCQVFGEILLICYDEGGEGFWPAEGLTSETSSSDE